MFKDNLVHLRKLQNYTQEDLAERVGVTRQAIAKWEAGESVPNLEKSRSLADTLGVSLDALACYEPEDTLGLMIPPKGKHVFGIVSVGGKGQIVIPAKARKLFRIKPGDQLMVLGDESLGLAVTKAEFILKIAKTAQDKSNQIPHSSGCPALPKEKDEKTENNP